MTVTGFTRGCAAVIALLVLAGCALLPAPSMGRDHTSAPSEKPAPQGLKESPPGSATPPLPEPPTANQISMLPEARYDAVIPGLLAYGSETVPEDSYQVYHLTGDAALYPDDRVAPVARLSAVDFLGLPTVVVPVELQPGWAKVLTPARQMLPSDGGGVATAQTAAWMPIDQLTDRTDVYRRIDVSVSERTLTIWQSAMLPRTWEIGIGTPETPTPSGVTGYLQARYLDPRQGQSEYPIQLTSLHAMTADEPYPGAEGGLIALHFAPRSAGEVSHGCIRLDADAIEAVDALPLGTPIVILP